MPMSSVAMITLSNFLARQQHSHTCRRRGLFAMRCSGFPGKRVERHRAGIIPTALFIGRLENDFGRGRQVFGPPICATAVSHFVDTRSNANGAYTGIMGALGVD